MSAVNNDSTPIFLPPVVVKEARNAKRMDTFAKVGLISLGVLAIAGTALAVVGVVKGIHLLNQSYRLDISHACADHLEKLGLGFFCTGIPCGLILPIAALVSIIAALNVTKAKDKIRELVNRVELKDAERFELYRRNQHRFTPREFYVEALQKVLRDEWNLNNGEVDVQSGVKHLKSFELSVKQFIADNATASDHADADMVMNDLLRSQMLQEQTVIESAADLLKAFSKDAKALTSPIPLQYLNYFGHLEAIPFAPNSGVELNAFEGEGKEVELKVDFVNCKDRELIDVQDLARVKKVEAVHIKDLTVAYDLIQRCPNAAEAIVEVPFQQSQANLRAFCKWVGRLPHCPKKLTVAIPKGHASLNPRDVVYPESGQPAKVTQTSTDTHDVYTYTLGEQAIAL